MQELQATTGELERLAHFLLSRNQVDAEIARLIGRPAEKGHIGEFIASRIFNIELESSATHKGADGRFQSGPLQGRSVNIKFYGKQDGTLAIRHDAVPDYFLVLTGPRAAAESSGGATRPLVIEHAYLFDGRRLVSELENRAVKFSAATSVAQDYWTGAEIFPQARNEVMGLDDQQHRLLKLFSSARIADEFRLGE